MPYSQYIVKSVVWLVSGFGKYPAWACNKKLDEIGIFWKFMGVQYEINEYAAHEAKKLNSVPLKAQK